MQHKSYSITITILMLFMLVIGVVLSVIIGLQYNFHKEIAFDSSKVLFEKTAMAVKERIHARDNRVVDMLNSLKNQDVIARHLIIGDLHQIRSIFETIIRQDDLLYSIYIGHESGDFYGLYNLSVIKKAEDRKLIPQNAAWAVVTVNTRRDGSKVRFWKYFDKNMVEAGERVEETDYDPTKGIWYKEAKKSSGVVKSEPYVLPTLGTTGVTFSLFEPKSKVVLGADLSSDSVSRFLATQKMTNGSKIVTLSAKGEVISSSEFAEQKANGAMATLDELGVPNADRLILMAKEGEQRFEVLGSGKESMFAMTSKISSSGEFLAMLSPMDEVMAPYLKHGMNAFMWTTMVVIFMLPIVYFTARKVAEPIKELVRVSNSVKRLDFEHVYTVDSRITEINQLSSAINDSANAIATYNKNLLSEQEKLQKLITAGIALSAEKDEDKLFEMILLFAKDLTNADGGTLYIKDGDELRFEIILNDTLNVKMGGTSGNKPTFPAVKLKNPETGQENLKNVASVAAIKQKTIVIDDAYESTEYDFSGTKIFDERNKYRSKSFCTIPLKPRGHDVIGVVQLINARDANGNVIPFKKDIIQFIEALASQAAVALENQQLLRAQIDLLDSLIKLIAGAIDAKSPYTGGHCERVPVLAIMLTEAACKDKEVFKDFELTTEDEWRELKIGAWLHDCGKVTTPEYVVDKATKLETIYNRIHEVRTRFEVLLRDAEIEYLNKKLEGGHDEQQLRDELEAKKKKIIDDFEFIANANVGGEFMKKEDIERIKEIAKIRWVRNLSARVGLSHIELERAKLEGDEVLPSVELLLSDKPYHIIPRDKNDSEEFAKYGFKMDVPENLYNFGEVYNLCVERGTLTPEERFKINEHVIQTIKMLEKLPLPKNMRRVPEIAGAHHETLIGTGYPRKLTKEQMSIPARIMAIADIFEALTASDRPYKKAKTLSEAIKILSFFKKDNHIDGDLFDLFLTSGVYKEYAQKYLMPEQIDEVDIAKYVTKTV